MGVQIKEYGQGFVLQGISFINFGRKCVLFSNLKYLYKWINISIFTFGQMGKFYELFEMDAHVGAKELDLQYMKVINCLFISMRCSRDLFYFYYCYDNLYAVHQLLNICFL